MDQLILAARDVVDAWENHTVELEVVIRRLAEALTATTFDFDHRTVDSSELSPAVA